MENYNDQQLLGDDMMNDVQHMIGKLVPDGVVDRDAVHVAVIPVTAPYLMLPGQRACADGSHPTIGGPPSVGIVDPFLRDCVQAGQRYWLFLLPNTVTGMVHRWSHPMFDGNEKLKEHLSKKGEGHE